MTVMENRFFKLTEVDLNFLVNIVAPESGDKDRLKRLIENDEEVRGSFIGDEKVFSRVVADDKSFVEISPQLYFEILLRKTRDQLENAEYTMEKTGREMIAVFDAKEVNELLSRKAVLLYLSDMLASFTKVESHHISYPIGKGIWRSIRYSDFDLDNLIKYCDWVEEEHKLGVFKRIGDLCLFILGMFPEYVDFSLRYPASGELRPRLPRQIRRSEEDYQEEGRKFYELAAEHPAARVGRLSEVFELLHEYFNAAKKPLSFLSRHYLHHRRADLFGMEATG